MEGKQSWMDRMDKKRDEIGEKLEKKEINLPIDLITGADRKSVV